MHEHPTGPACAHRPRAQHPGRAPHACCRALAARAPATRTPAASTSAARAPRARAPTCLLPVRLPLARPAVCGVSARAPAAPTPARAPACTPRAHAVPLPAHALRTQPLAPRAPRLRAQRLPAQRPARPAPAPSAPPARLLAVSWLGWALYRNTVQPCLCPTVAIHLSVLRYNPAFPAFSYNSVNCIAIQFQANTPILQYNPTAFFSAIQISVLQYNSHSLKYDWAVAHSKSAPYIFFFQLFLAIGKIIKKHQKLFFFSIFNNTSNKFIKIYFSPFLQFFNL